MEKVKGNAFRLIKHFFTCLIFMNVGSACSKEEGPVAAPPTTDGKTSSSNVDGESQEEMNLVAGAAAKFMAGPVVNGVVKSVTGDIIATTIIGGGVTAVSGGLGGVDGINPGFNPGILPGGINPPGNLPNAPIFPGILPGGSGNGGLTLPGNVDSEAKAAFDKGNAYRQQNGLQPLQWSTIISTECDAQAQAQIAQGMNHWLVPHPNSRAENIASGQTSGSEVATTWYDSEGHKRNLLGRYTQSAVGRAGGGSRKQWCQRFN